MVGRDGVDGAVDGADDEGGGGGGRGVGERECGEVLDEEEQEGERGEEQGEREVREGGRKGIRGRRGAVGGEVRGGLVGRRWVEGFALKSKEGGLPRMEASARKSSCKSQTRLHDFQRTWDIFACAVCSAQGGLACQGTFEGQRLRASV